jgi:hypothetical protein
MTEPDVTLTDYGLFLECAAFAWLVARQPSSRRLLRAWAAVFFAATALAALFGGTVHGFFAREAGAAGVALWKASLLAIGTTALAGWAIGAHAIVPAAGAAWVVRVAALFWIAYAAVILLVDDRFGVAIAGYVPAALALLAAFGRIALRTGARWAWLGASGLGLSFVAALIQQLRIAVHPVYFDHNALYHLVQAAGLALVFIGLRGLLQQTGGLRADAT